VAQKVATIQGRKLQRRRFLSEMAETISGTHCTRRNGWV